MLKGDRQVDLEFSVAGRPRIVGKHRRAALAPGGNERDQPNRNKNEITTARDQSDRKPKASSCSAPSLVGWERYRVTAWRALRIGRTVDKFDASSDRSPWSGRSALSSTSAPPSIYLALLP